MTGQSLTGSSTLNLEITDFKFFPFILHSGDHQYLLLSFIETKLLSRLYFIRLIYLFSFYERLFNEQTLAWV